MVNQSYVFTIPASWTRFYLFKERMDAVDMSVYCFGFLSNIPILWIFFTEGFASTSNINFFALGVADLSVCIFFIMQELLFKWLYSLCFEYTTCLDMREIWTTYFFPNQEAIKSFSAWITALITLERLLCITFPLKVSSHTETTKY